MLRKLLLFIGLVLLYSAFLTQTHYWDGVLFSLYIEKVYRAELPHSILFHPNHLLYSGFGYLFYSFAHGIGLHLRAITVLQCINVFASAGTAVLVFALADGLYGSRQLAFFCSILFALGATWWRFSTDADSYIPSVLLLLLTISFVVGERRSLLFAGVCHSLAMLFHQLAVFAYAPLLIAIFWENRLKATRIRQALVYLLGTAGCVTLIYWLAYEFAGRDSGRTFPGWVTSFSTESQVAHSWQQIFVAYPISYLKLLAGGKLSFIRDYFSLPVVAALIVSGAALLAGILWMRHGQCKNSTSSNRRTQAVLWAWVLPYVLFLAWWEPGSAFYKLFIWPPLVLLLGCFIVEHTFWISRQRSLLAFSIALAAWNFAGFIFPHSHSNSDPVIQLAKTIDRELSKNATVYYKVLSPDDWYLQYFAPGRRWLQLPSNTRTVQQLNQDANAPVCLETTALAEFESQAVTGPSWSLLNNKHHVRFACLK